MPDLINSEKKILAKIKKTMTFSFGNHYMFWFVYDDNHKAIDWEGGYGLYDDSKPKPTEEFSVGGNNKFRNQYTLSKDNSFVQNWS